MLFIHHPVLIENVAVESEPSRSRWYDGDTDAGPVAADDTSIK
jgi:hypothetical protein